MAIPGIFAGLGALAQRAIPYSLKGLQSTGVGRGILGIGRSLLPFSRGKTKITSSVFDPKTKTTKYFSGAKDVTDKIKGFNIKPTGKFKGKVDPQTGVVTSTGEAIATGGVRPTISGYATGIYGASSLYDLVTPEKQKADNKDIIDSFKVPPTSKYEVPGAETSASEEAIKDISEQDKEATLKRAEDLKEIFGTDFKDQAKLQGNFALMQAGLNLMSGKSKQGNTIAGALEIIGEGLKEPVKTLQSVAYDLGEKENELKLLAYEDVKEDRKTKEARQFERETLEIQLDAQRKMFEDEQATAFILQKDAEASALYEAGDPRKGAYVSAAISDFADSPGGTRIGFDAGTIPKPLMMDNDDMENYYDSIVSAENDAERQDIIETAAQQFNVGRTFLKKVFEFMDTKGGTF